MTSAVISQSQADPFFSDDVKFLVTVASVLVAAVAIWINGYRADRVRRRILYADAWQAIVEYKEFAFAVRRRDADHPGPERVRLTTALSDVQARIAKLEALLQNERCQFVSDAYADLVVETRQIAGGIIRRSWNEAPIERDDEIHAPEIAEELTGLRQHEKTFHKCVRHDLRWWRGRRSRRRPT